MTALIPLFFNFLQYQWLLPNYNRSLEPCVYAILILDKRLLIFQCSVSVQVKCISMKAKYYKLWWHATLIDELIVLLPWMVYNSWTQHPDPIMERKCLETTRATDKNHLQKVVEGFLPCWKSLLPRYCGPCLVLQPQFPPCREPEQ